MTEISKGTECWFFGYGEIPNEFGQHRNQENKVYCHRVMIQSFGKFRATATFMENGEFMQRVIRPFDYYLLYPVADHTDPSTIGVEIAAKCIEMSINAYKMRIHQLEKSIAEGELVPYVEQRDVCVKEIERLEAMVPEFIGEK